MYLTQPLHKARRERPRETFTIFGERRRTNAEAVDRIARLAKGLHALGAGPGDRIGMLAQNSDRYVEFMFATLWAGGVINPVNSRWSPQEIAYSLDDCDTRILVVDDAFAPLVEPLRGLSKSLRRVVFAGEGAPPEGAIGFEDLIAEHEPAKDAFRNGDDLAAILYTGGTTGHPKGVMLTHAGFTYNGLSTNVAAANAGAAPGLHVAPLFHVAGTAVVFEFSRRRCPQVLMPAFEPGEALRLIEKHRIGDIFLVPTMLRWLVDHPDRPTTDTSSLKSIRYGAAPIDATLLEEAMAAFPGVNFLQAYGQTECGPVVTILGPEDHAPETRNPERLRSAGRPVPIAEVKIVDPEDNELPAGQVGEIAVRGPCVMKGYWNKPKQTREALRGGWMHSGDAGYMDEDGYLFVVDRVKDMIITGGENVYSAEVENALAAAPGVAEVAVIAVPDEQWGERVHAVIVPEPGAAPTLEELRAFCRERIAGYKAPRSIELVEAMPLSPAGKILKHALRAPHWKSRGRSVN